MRRVHCGGLLRRLNSSIGLLALLGGRGNRIR